MFMEVVRAYKVFKTELVADELGIGEAEMRSLLVENKNPQYRYLMDPVTRTVHQVEAKSRLQLNLEAINKLLKAKQVSVLSERAVEREGGNLDIGDIMERMKY
jgi:hypothetical protein